MYHYTSMMPWQQHYDMDARNNMHPEHVCHKYRDYYVIGYMADGSQIEGIIDDVDENGVTMLIPEMVDEHEVDDPMYRMYGGFGGYGGYRRRYRRFRRRRFPYVQFVFPFFIPFPFYF